MCYIIMCYIIMRYIEWRGAYIQLQISPLPTAFSSTSYNLLLLCDNML